MKIERKLGIWLDHADAHIIDCFSDTKNSVKVESEFTHDVKISSLHKSEHTMHNKEQQLQTAYYEHLGSIILNYTAVLLFGPTDAKLELLHKLRADHHFDDIRIDIASSDKMTENQEFAFVKKHFSGSSRL
jgi:hypothetical protein